MKKYNMKTIASSTMLILFDSFMTERQSSNDKKTEISKIN